MKYKKTRNPLAFILLFICIFAVIFVLHGSFVFAADVVKDKIEDKSDELEKIEKKIEKTQDIILLKQKEKNVISAQIKNLANEHLKVAQKIEENEGEIVDLTSSIDRIKNEIEKKENHISLQKKILKKFLREKYQNYSENAQYFTALNIANSNQQNHSDNLSHASSSISNFVQKIHKEQESLKKDQVNFEKKSDRIQDAKYELEQRSAHLKSSQDYKRVLAAEVSVEKNKYEDKLSKLFKEQIEIHQEISSLSTGHAGEFSLKDLPNPKNFSLGLPVKKPYVLTQGYGKTSFSHNYPTGVHNGIDYVAKGSQSIIAAGDGKIKATGNMGRYGYGRWVAIDHGNGLVTLYGHMSSVKVSRGDKVDKGDKIGTMGNTGFSIGPHVHFSVFAKTTFGIVESSRVKGVFIPSGATVNPNIYL